MLATLVIGLREGLEAALIVGIIAAFLRRNGKSLRPMWLGVVLAVLLSIVVGVGLSLVEQALPQAQQEALETVIGVVAVFFVTGMIAWMNSHSRDMKGQIEADAAEALGSSSVYALSMMAFLAVLKEGFETSVFLLATFSAAQSTMMAALGAVIGLVLAVIIGWGIYVGGVKINLSRFFRITGAFLILVAAGLTITVLRTAHEAGWLNAGQQLTVNLSWLVAPGTVQSALITGVLGIPADPRLIEVLGWLAYLIPVGLCIYWPQRKRPGPRGSAYIQGGIGLALVAAAVILPLACPQPHLPNAATVPADLMAARSHRASGQQGSLHLALSTDQTSGTLTLRLPNGTEQDIALPAKAHKDDQHNGQDISTWTLADTTKPQNLPAQVSLNDVVALSGGRIPIGINPRENPGPFHADWTVKRSLTVWAFGDTLLEGSERATTVVTVSGSGLRSPRTFTVRGDLPAGRLPVSWQVASSYSEQALSALADQTAEETEYHFWTLQLPILLAFGALILFVLAATKLVRLPKPVSDPEPSESL